LFDFGCQQAFYRHMHIRWIPAVLIAFLWSGLILFAVRRYWRPANDPKSLSDLQLGKWWGVGMNIVCAFVLPTIVQLPGLSYWIEVLYFGFIGFPFFVVGGHYVGRVIKLLIDAQFRK
jgi:hypothetical protein